MLDDDGNGINGEIMQITKQTHVTNLTMFTSAVAQLLSANAISSCILYENKVKLKTNMTLIVFTTVIKSTGYMLS